MGPTSLKDHIKHLVYRLVLPIYLWSIGYKSLEGYIRDIEQEYELYHRTNLLLAHQDMVDPGAGWGSSINKPKKSSLNK
jgi:hypothetical protein